jgi:hypothetical protein
MVMNKTTERFTKNHFVWNPSCLVGPARNLKSSQDGLCIDVLQLIRPLAIGIGIFGIMPVVKSSFGYSEADFEIFLFLGPYQECFGSNARVEMLFMRVRYPEHPGFGLRLSHCPYRCKFNTGIES